MKTLRVLLFLAVATLAASAQSQTLQQLVGTVKAFRAESAEVVVQPDSGGAVTVKVAPTTVLQRIAPGEKDLKHATSIAISDIALGDRVLTTLLPTLDARRIVVMTANAISSKQEADQQDWIRRGVHGVVTAKTPTSLTLKVRSLANETEANVVIDAKTTFHRYAPDSVKFSDARASKLDEVQKGDQLRARGTKNENGSRVEAEAIVFGSFVTRAGSITSIDPAARVITLKDAGNKKLITVKLTADSQLKTMPRMEANPMLGMGPPMGGGAGGPGGFGMPRAGDIAQMLERMPSVLLAELKAGDMVVVSSTKGAQPDQLTAIMLVGNADMLVQMARRSAQANRSDSSLSLSGGGFGGLDLPGMIN
jgi:hypothetical protein